MAGIIYNNRGWNEKVNVIDTDLEEFRVMRGQVNDMVSNTFFEHGIITYEDREMLRKLLEEINDTIQDMEMAPHELVVSGQYLSERNLETRDRYRNMMYAFDNNKSIADAVKEDDMYKGSTSLHSDSSEPEDYAKHNTGQDKKDQPQRKINHGYDEEEHYNESKDVKRNHTADRRNNLISGHENVGYYGDTTYFVDDKEETRMLTVAAEDNWTLRNPNHASPVEVAKTYDADSSGKGYNFAHRSSAHDENISNMTTNRFIHDYEDDENDYDDVAVVRGVAAEDVELHFDDESGYDDVAVVGIAPEEVELHDDDIKHALEGFDYLHETDENNDVDVKDALSGFNYLDDLDLIHEDHIKDALGNFDYLDDLDEHRSKRSSIVTQNSSRQGSLNNVDYEEPSVTVFNAHKDRLQQKPENTPNVHDLEDISYSAQNVNKRIFDEDTLEFRNHNSHASAEATYENKGEANEPTQLHKNEYMAYRQKARGFQDTDMQMLPEKYNRNNYNTKDSRAAELVARTRSEEVVSGFTAGEFILRRTRSEDIQDPQDPHAAGRHKALSHMEPLPEDRRSSFTESDSIGYVKKGSSGTDHCSICSSILKVLLIFVFGIGATKIILGVVFRNSCQVKDVVPICVIASGAVSLCYCFIFLAMILIKKRSGKISRTFRTFLVVTWVVLLGLIIAGCVLLYPSIQEDAFTDCSVQEDCCNRKLTLTAFGAIITDIICLICFVIILCCAK